MKTLGIFFTSTTGGTTQLVDAAHASAREVLSETPEARVRVWRAEDATAADILGCAAILWATPEHLGSMAGGMKLLVDRAYYPCLDKLEGRLAALLVCAGTDGTGTVRQFQRILTGWRMRLVAPPAMVLTHAHRPEDILRPKVMDAASLQVASELGGVLAAQLC
jgi:multimeric flavodoxin WrbA